MKSRINNYLNQPVDAFPLAVFRFVFGAIMCIAIFRFYYHGWISKLYIEPTFFFKYSGFEWVRPLGEYTPILFFICGVSSFLVMIGYRYRLAILFFFLSFTYIELMDKTNYLNHYYFVTCISFLLLVLPIKACLSLESKRKGIQAVVPQWNVDAIRLMLSIVWFYAGLAKLNSDWLLEAQPLSIWLPSKYEVPLLGAILQKEISHYIFSWAGALYDLSIPFFLWNKSTRMIGFVLVIVFHVLTWLLFPIGVFPWLMIGSSLIFFEGKRLRHLLALPKFEFKATTRNNFFNEKAIKLIVIIFFIFQILFPFRYFFNKGELFWTEQGYRFSWRVMLMEKAGYANFKVVDSSNNKQFYVQNDNFLTPLQEKHLSTQPDFIIEYAQFLKSHYTSLGLKNPKIYVESYVALNGRSSQVFVKPDIDLTQVDNTWKPIDILMPFNDKIKGF